MPTESEIFATLHHLVSGINAEDRVQEVADKARVIKPEDIQLLVDCLSTALDKNAAPLKCRAYVWRALIRVTSSAKLFAQNHTLRSDHITPDNDSPPGVYRISREPSLRIQVLKTKDNVHEPYSESIVSWAHLSHPNIIPLYSVLLEEAVHPSLVYPCVANGSICDYVRETSEAEAPRLPLISDVVNAMYYMHQLDVAHGGLSPQTVLVTCDGRALITSLDTTPEIGGSYNQTSARYSAPELFGEDDIQPTKAADMWSFACLCYEVLYGKIPFYQITNDFKVSGAIARGAKPIRPSQDEADFDEIHDMIWQLLLMCWEYEPEDRPPCLKVHQVLLGMDIQDDRPKPSSMISPDFMQCSSIDPMRARATLVEVLGPEHASSLRVPEQLRSTLFGLMPNTVKFEATATAAKKLSPDDTQCLVDFLDLVLEDLPHWAGSESQATQTLLSKTMMSTHIIPKHYKLNEMQYDAHVPIMEGSFGKAYQGRGMRVRVNVVTSSSLIRAFLRSLSDWCHSSHPNVIPFYGVFHEGVNESRHLCVVTPLWQNGNLRHYAPTLPQKSRMILILDVACGLSYLHEMSTVYGTDAITPEKILISNEGRAILSCYDTHRMFTESGAATASTYELRFIAPNASSFIPHDIWSLGCLCYEVLTQKPPYYQYTEATQIQSAVSQGELPKRPERSDEGIEEVNEQVWELITNCCSYRWEDRPRTQQVRERIANMVEEDDRPEANILPETGILMLRSRPDLDFSRVEALLGKIQVELLRSPLVKLIQSRTKDVAAAATMLGPDDTRTLVDFLDLALKDHLTISDERNRALALLSRVTSSTCIFPQRYEVKGIKYRPMPIAEGGFATVHEGINLKMCIKVMTRVDPKAFTEWIKELILWAHSSHPNVLPFYGVFLEDVGDFQRICLVSPFMKNGNLHDYAPRLPQKSRLSLILDVINGLQYIHGLGIIHSDLKGQNVLISDEGRGFITDFGASHIVTTTATATTSSVHSTLRFAAPELMEEGAQPSKECDIWSFGCLCYEVLTRKPPYYQYARDFQVAAALSRKELPKRPGPTERNDTNNSDEDNWDDDDDDIDEDSDAIDDQGWNLITTCCAPSPKDRLQTPAIKELIVDMKIWDERPPMKTVPGAEIFKLRLDPEIDLNRVGEILDQLQASVAPFELSPQRDFSVVWNELK